MSDLTDTDAGDEEWLTSLTNLARTAELKKHSLSLQLHTAHILATHASLDEKTKTLEDVKEQYNRLESERARLLAALHQVNEDRSKLQNSVNSLHNDCTDLRTKIQTITDGEYMVSKQNVDTLRLELGQQALPSLQSLLDNRTSAYLTSRRLKGPHSQAASQLHSSQLAAPSEWATPTRRSTTVETVNTELQSSNKRSRGRPKGSKNKPRY